MRERGVFGRALRRQPAKDGGDTAEMRDPFLTDELENLARADFAQTNMLPAHRIDAPREAPPVAVAHWQGPEIAHGSGAADLEHPAQGVQISAPVIVEDPLGPSGCSARVIDRNGREFVRGLPGNIFVPARGDELFVLRPFEWNVLAGVTCHLVHDVHEHFDGREPFDMLAQGFPAL